MERRCVWVVDDSELDADRAQRALGGRFDVQVHRDGAVALEALGGHEPGPDVLVLDWLMPGVSGIDVCRFVRSAGPPMERLPILLLTVHQRPEQVVEGLGAGANDFLSKPYAEQELLARVTNLVRQQELVERAERAELALRKLLTFSPDALLVVSEAGKITFANPEAEAVLRQSGLRGQSVEDLFPSWNEWSSETASTPSRADDICIGDEVFEPTVRRMGDDSRPEVVVSLRNVTAQRAEQARRLDFYSMVTHDLRSPLSSALLRTEMMLEGVHGVLSPGMQDDLHRLQKNLRELIGMINDFLEIARQDSGAEVLEKERVDLPDLVKTTVDDFAPLAAASKLQLVTAAPEEPICVIGDGRRLKLVVSNFVANALKFTPAGGEVSVDVGVESDGWARVTVRDTGPGIDEKALPTIFNRYSRVSQGAQGQPQVSGSGLGLMIVERTVEAHGGRVGVESQPGRGSAFWFELPCAS